MGSNASEDADGRSASLLGALAALRGRVDEFFRAADAAGGLQCRAGCDACCRVDLTVGPLEAEALAGVLAELPAAARERLSEHAGHPDVRAGLRCVFLGDAGRCAVYAGRPMVCRSQGLARSYALEGQGDLPDVPLAALRGRAGEKGVGACPLNYEDALPAGDLVLDADRVDEVLAQLQLAWARLHGLPPLARVALRDLAAAAPAIAGPDAGG